MPRRPLPVDAPLPPEARGAPLMIFDGTCVFCSAGARFVHRLDRRRNVRFAHAQSPLGLSLYRHFGWETENFRTNILIMDGTVHSKWATIGAMGRAMGGGWRAFSIFELIPDFIGDRLYDLVASNRYRLFGRTETCIIPDEAMRARMIDIG